MARFAFVVALILTVCSPGAPSPKPDVPGCPSPAGCGASIYGVATIAACADDAPMEGALVLVFDETHPNQPRVINYRTVEADGSFAVPLVPGDFSLALVYQEEQQPVEVNGAPAELQPSFTLPDRPWEMNLHVFWACM